MEKKETENETDGGNGKKKKNYFLKKKSRVPTERGLARER